MSEAALQTLTGFEVVYYYKNLRLYAGNKMMFPIRKPAEIYKKHYAARPYFDAELKIEEIKYQGIPLPPYQIFNEKEVIDKDHYFGMDTCEPEDYFTDDVVDMLINMLPPACLRQNCTQIGGAYDHKYDKHGRYKPTFATFEKITDKIWRYCGLCFYGENEPA